MNIGDVVSIVVGALSVLLGITSVVIAFRAEAQSRQSQERTRDLLAEIDKRSALMEEKVSDNYQKMVDHVAPNPPAS